MCLVDPPNLLIVELTSVTKKTSEGCLFRWRVGLGAGRRSCRQCEGKGMLGSRIQTSTSTRCVGIVDNLYAKKAHDHIWGRILESLNIDDIRKCGSQLLEAKKWGPSFSGTNPYLHVGLKMEY